MVAPELPLSSSSDVATFHDLPDASSPELVLVHPTPAELARTWRHTYPKWGSALPREQDYLEREAYLTTAPLGRDGGLTRWILTVRGMKPGERPILSSCESLRKRAVVARPQKNKKKVNGTTEEDKKSGEEEVVVVDGIAHAIGSVFTEPAYRGRGYASRMMREVGEKLRTWQAERTGSPRTLFSVLYSDIGKHFYSRHGWAAYPSTHVSFKPAAVITTTASATAGVDSNTTPPGSPLPNNNMTNTDPSRVSPPPSPSTTTRSTTTSVSSKPTGTPKAHPLGYHELAELCATDERLLRSHLARSHKPKPTAAILPDLDAMLWHLMREDFMTKRIFGHTPTIRGAVAGEREKGNRVWAVWMRAYYGGVDRPEGNTLHILRVVVENENEEEDGGKEENEKEQAAALGEIIKLAQQEAVAWRTGEVQVWNPTGTVARLLEKCGIGFERVEREVESIPSLMWYGDDNGEGDDDDGEQGVGGGGSVVEWVANEKYAWF
ncbi:hypothetical protein VTJ04DRAFT_5190 [Mycothermus thermophilus]|uniref:uncharacterized protein n=1 Tax=Humicola insolens TaxID=85995 RepID=UPI003743C564